MKRLVIAIIIFTLTISFCVSGFLLITNKGEEMIDLLTYYSHQAEISTKEELTEIAEKINKEWSKRSTLFKSVFIHNDFSEIETLIDKLNIFAEQNSPDSFSECCTEAISRLNYALNNEKPKIQNIF